MIIFKLILTLAVVTIISCITIPVDSLKDRCMVVYSKSEEDYLKIDIKFQRFHKQTSQEGYRITLINTQNQYKEIFTVEEGTFRKELQLSLNVIYQLCIRIILNRPDGGQVQQQIEYNCGMRLHANLDVGSIEVPANLLNVKDLKDSYSHLRYMQHLQGVMNEFLIKQKQKQDTVFSQQNGQIKKLQWLNFVEVAVICLFGGYQFIRLRRIIYHKQNI